MTAGRDGRRGTAPGAGQGLGVLGALGPARMVRCAAAAALLALPGCYGDAPTAGRLLPHLPLVEVRAEAGGAADARPPRASMDDVLAVFLTGDGGWVAFPREIATRLADAGVAVVGFDSRRFLETRRTPDQVARALADVSATYLEGWERSRLVVVGFSRGANLAVFGAAGLSDPLRDRLDAVVLLAPATREKFLFRLTDILRRRADERGRPVADAAAGLDGLRVRCVNGLDEPDPLCPQLVGRPGVSVTPVPGGHHLGRDYDALAALILDEIRGSAGEEPSRPAGDQGGDVPDDARQGQPPR